MPKIKNQLYLDFKAGKVIKIFTRDMLDSTLHNITFLYSDGRFRKNRNYPKAARALMIILWVTGARPAEIANLIVNDIEKVEGNAIRITLRTLKGGETRYLTLSLKDKFMKEFWEYAASYTVPNQFLFWMFRSTKKRSNIKVWKIKKDRITGEKKSFFYKDYTGRIYDMSAQQLWYYVRKWVSGVIELSDEHEIPPYYFRHSRLTVIADDEGNTIEEVRQFKGAKSYKSCLPYMHQTPRQAKKLGKGALK